MVKVVSSLIFFIFLSFPTQAEELDGVIVPLTFNVATYYTQVALNGIVGTYLVDTGAGRTIVSHKIFQALSELGELRLVGKIAGHQANGELLKGTRYRVQHMHIGNCYMEEMVIAYFPDIDQNILGMSSLEEAAPFVFDPGNDRLILTNCDKYSTFPSPSSNLKP